MGLGYAVSSPLRIFLKNTSKVQQPSPVSIEPNPKTRQSLHIHSNQTLLTWDSSTNLHVNSLVKEKISEFLILKWNICNWKEYIEREMQNNHKLFQYDTRNGFCPVYGLGSSLTGDSRRTWCMIQLKNQLYQLYMTKEVMEPRYLGSIPPKKKLKLTILKLYLSTVNWKLIISYIFDICNSQNDFGQLSKRMNAVIRFSNRCKSPTVCDFNCKCL